MTKNILRDEYFTWLRELIGTSRRSNKISYEKLLSYLHSTDFRYSLEMDGNRAEDGVDLRYRFALAWGYEDAPELILDALQDPCSVLEMMIALAIRCEETIMDDAHIGDRTGQWFWGMVVNLGLGSMSDDRFDELYVEAVVERFLNREYEPNGSGGLFTIRHCDRDVRTMEIWHQLCWYLDSIT